MDIQFFQTFLTVAKFGNMTQAAARLNFSQPTVTGQIRALERHFGTSLFERVGKRLFITEAGQNLIGYAERITAAYDQASEALDAFPGSINLGSSTSVTNYLLLPIFREFQTKVPNGTVTMEFCPAMPGVVKGILENRFDIGFANQRSPATQQLRQYKIFTEQMAWVAVPALLNKCNNSWEIGDYPVLIYKTGGFFRALYNDLLAGKTFRSVIEYTDAEALKKGVLSGLGCGALPLVMIRSLLQQGALVEFAAVPRLSFSIWLMLHKDKVLSRPTRTFLKILPEYVTVDEEVRLFFGGLP